VDVVVRITAMVVDHIASLTPPPPLLLHASPQAAWDSQMVKPPL
jgi:hypothetical protein